MRRPAYMNRRGVFARLLDNSLALVGALAITAGFFFLLPLIKAITKSPKADMQLTQVDSGVLPPPPPPPPEEQQQEEQEPDEPPPPELADEAPPLDLSDLESALSAGDGGFGGSGLLDLTLNTGSGGDDGGGLFALNDLDQRPRCTYQPAPVVPLRLSRKGPATVTVMFIVSPEGRVVSPKIKSSSNSAFDQAALKAVRRWRFDPGKVGGKAVRSPMVIPIKFSKG